MLVAEDGTVIAGHGRLLVAQHPAQPKVPVMVAKGSCDDDIWPYPSENYAKETCLHMTSPAGDQSFRIAMFSASQLTQTGSLPTA